MYLSLSYIPEFLLVFFSWGSAICFLSVLLFFIGSTNFIRFYTGGFLKYGFFFALVWGVLLTMFFCF